MLAILLLFCIDDTAHRLDVILNLSYLFGPAWACHAWTLIEIIKKEKKTSVSLERNEIRQKS